VKRVDGTRLKGRLGNSVIEHSPVVIQRIEPATAPMSCSPSNQEPRPRTVWIAEDAATSFLRRWEMCTRSSECSIV